MCRVQLDHTYVVTRVILFATSMCFNIAVSAQQRHYPILISADSAEVWFDQNVNQQTAAIVNGPEYYISFKGLKTHPFYQSPESDRSFIRYDNDLYKNTDLLYDTYLDILILKCLTPNAVYFIQLDNNFVQGFDLHGHHFKKFDAGIHAGTGAYFDVLFEESQFAVLAKRRKLKQVEVGTSDYLENDVYYILNHGKWNRITGKGSFSKLVNKEQRKELAAFIRSNHIKVKKHKDEDLRKLGAFCYQLKERKE